MAKRKSGSGVKGRPARSPSAREPAAASKGNRAERRRASRAGKGSRRRRWLPWVSVGVVAAAAVTIVAAGLTHGTKPASKSAAAPGTVARAVRTVPASVFDEVGVPSSLVPPIRVAGQHPPLVSGKLPQVLYVGAEFCPFCAAERWAMAVALNRFGSFKGLGITESSTSDVYPGTKTLTFFGSHFTSPYLVFTPVETTTNQRQNGSYAPLQTPTAGQQRIMNEFDVAPYTTQAGGIPFIDFGNKIVVTGPSFSPQVLQGLSWQQIAAQLSDPTSRVAQSVDGSANLLTAAICEVTNGQPASVCDAPVVERAGTRFTTPG